MSRALLSALLATVSETCLQEAEKEMKHSNPLRSLSVGRPHHMSGQRTVSRHRTVAAQILLLAAGACAAAALTSDAATANTASAYGPQTATAALTPTAAFAVPAPTAHGVREISSAYNSGYLASACCGRTVAGGSFTAVSGTFNVPRLVAPSDGVAVELAVGLQGTNDNGKLIEAGVGVYWDGTTEAWWDTAATSLRRPITLPINRGDRITITIERARGGGSSIRLVDHTIGLGFTTRQRYGANGDQAFWLVRDQPVLRGGAVARFAPKVSFTNLRISKPNGELRRIAQRNQDGVPILTPSAIGSTGFTVSYRVATPAAQ
jgi:hypothetical protein